MKKPILALLALLLGLAGYFLFKSRPSALQTGPEVVSRRDGAKPAIPPASQTGLSPAPVSNVAGGSPVAPAVAGAVSLQLPASTATPATAPSAVSAEVAASRRMYVAHAPLRQPELADPNSETNRRVLRTMVQKALERETASANQTRRP